MARLLGKARSCRSSIEEGLEGFSGLALAYAELASLFAEAEGELFDTSVIEGEL